MIVRVEDDFDINIFNVGAHEGESDRWILVPHTLWKTEDGLQTTGDMMGKWTLTLSKDEVELLQLEDDDYWVSMSELLLTTEQIPNRVAYWIDNVLTVL